ncbi:MAG: hypothetical protein CVT70_03980 [Alphaproteobacteria bacterium HGW-Alphaproteobacteria-1]|jgi:hypothetical protein|nr:MAG: hypothetical protein CVT70_03980 [Alphaproteobacteria bacterium HGW-Alphaproteobacteria-1]
MIRAAVFCLALWLAAPALAQSVTVRSGAHDGFDRLVIDLPRRLDYRTEAGARDATFVFDVPILRFDISAVFARIGRNRLRALAAPDGQGRLRLDLACDCRLNPFWHGEAMLVIDIADPPPPSLTPPLTPRSAARLGPAAPSPATEALAARLDPALAPESEPDVARVALSPDLDRMHSILLHQLGRAASQGLVMTAPEARQVHLATPSSDPPAPAPVAVDAQAARPADPIALRAQTSMDRDVTEGGRAARSPVPSEPDCPAPALLDVPSWGNPVTLPEDMGRLYRDLYGEFDAINPHVAHDLARFYIHHGFGAEARQILTLADAPNADTRLLRDLAQLVDQMPLSANSPLHDATGCGEPAVLWALLARGPLDAALTFDHGALQRSFAALPAGLRRGLGPGLVRNLVAVGHADTAQHLQRVIERIAAPGEAGTGLARADLAAHTAGPDMAVLAEVSRSNTLHAAEALALAIEAALLRGAPVAVDQAQLAGAYAHELRDTEIGDRLAVAQVAALAAAGAFDEAANAFDRRASDRAQPVARAMAESLLREAVRAADDLTFLRYVLSDRFMPPEAMSDQLVGAIARRLLDAGFADAADRVLRPVRSDPALRLLRAEIALALQRPAEADLALLDLNGPDADRLRARARSLRGDHASAQALFAASDALSEADRAALYTRDPKALARASDPLLHEVAHLLRGLSNPVPAAVAPLDQSVALLAETALARATLARLLAGTPRPEDDDR